MKTVGIVLVAENTLGLMAAALKKAKIFGSELRRTLSLNPGSFIYCVLNRQLASFILSVFPCKNEVSNIYLWIWQAENTGQSFTLLDVSYDKGCHLPTYYVSGTVKCLWAHIILQQCVADKQSNHFGPVFLGLSDLTTKSPESQQPSQFGTNEGGSILWSPLTGVETEAQSVCANYSVSHSRERVGLVFKSRLDQVPNLHSFCSPQPCSVNVAFLAILLEHSGLHRYL